MKEELKTPLTHRPKGRMCCSCVNRSADCSELPFNGMRVISKDMDSMLVVRCSNFEREC